MNTKILIIDDDAKQRNLICSLLQPEGYTVFEVDNGKSGIDLAIDERPRIILLNYHLSDMEWHSFSWIIRNTGWVESIPIIALTSKLVYGQKEKMLVAGITDYIETPINPATFADQIKIYFETRD